MRHAKPRPAVARFWWRVQAQVRSMLAVYGVVQDQVSVNAVLRNTEIKYGL